MKIGDEVYVHGRVDEIRHIQSGPDMVIIQNSGGYFGTVKSEIYCGGDIDEMCMKHYRQGREDERAFQNGELMQAFDPE